MNNAGMWLKQKKQEWNKKQQSKLICLHTRSSKNVPAPAPAITAASQDPEEDI